MKGEVAGAFQGLGRSKGRPFDCPPVPAYALEEAGGTDAVLLGVQPTGTQLTWAAWRQRVIIAA